MDLERLKIDRSEPAPARRRRQGRGIGIWVILVLAIAAGWVFRRPIVERVDQWRLPHVEVVRALKPSALEASAVSGTAANGYVVARHRAALSADTPGRIVAMNVEEGSIVRAGDVVARLYSDEYEAALRRAEADVVAARAGLGRTEAEVTAAEKQVEELVSREHAAEARLEESRASLGLAQKSFDRSERLVAERVVTVERLDADQAELLRAKARVTANEASLEEARAVVTTGESNLAVARASVGEARARITVLEAARDQARATLAKTEVRAPFDGIVVLKDAEVGEVVSPNAQGAQSRGSVVTMVDFDSLEVQVEVPETSLAAVELDAQAEIFLDAFPDRRYTGRVLRIWPTANRQKATVEVRVGFDETDELLRPEMGARVVFAPKREAGADGDGGPALDGGDVEPSVLLPTACLVQIDGRTGAFVLERDVARFTPLELGAESSGRVAVLAGLSGGELVVSNPPPSLDDDERVRIKE